MSLDHDVSKFSGLLIPLNLRVLTPLYRTLGSQVAAQKREALAEMNEPACSGRTKGLRYSAEHSRALRNACTWQFLWQFL